MKRTFLRVVSMCLAVIMLVGVANLSVFASQVDTGNDAQTLQSTVRANVARDGSVIEINERQIIAELYADFLSAEEKAVLASEALLGSSYTFTKPVDCVDVDKEAKKVTAEVVAGDAEHDWIPKRARVIVDGEPAMEVVFVGNEASFAGLSATNYMVEVDYELELAVEDTLELKLVNAAANLSGAKRNFDKIVGLKGNLDLIVAATVGEQSIKPLEEMYKITYAAGGLDINGNKIELAQGPAADAIVALYNEAQGNDGHLKLYDYIVAYEEAENQVKYILDNGQDMMDVLKATRELFAALCAKNTEDTATAPYTTLDEFVDRVKVAMDDLQDELNGYKGQITSYETLLSNSNIDPSTKAFIEIELAKVKAEFDTIQAQLDDANEKVAAFELMMSTFDTMYATMETVSDKYAAAYNADSAVKADATDVELAELNAAVQQINTEIVIHGLASKQTYTLTETLQSTVNQGIISVDVIAYVWENGERKTVGSGKIDSSFAVDKDTAGSVVENLIASKEIAITTAINEGWSNAYGVNKTNYTISYVDVPDVVTGNATCVVVFSPNSFDITCEFDGLPATAEYGQTVYMPASVVEGTSYTYIVTDENDHSENRLEGEGYDVTSDITVERKEGMAMGDAVSVPNFVANSTIPGAELTAKDRLVLDQAAIVGSESTIRYGIPKSGVTLKLVGGAEGAYEYSVSAVPHTTTLAYKANAAAEPQIGYAEWVPVEVKYLDNGVAKTAPYSGTGITVNTTAALTGVDVVYRLVMSESENAWWLSNAKIVELATLADALTKEAKEQISNITSIKKNLADNEQMLAVGLGAVDTLLNDYAAVNPAGAVIARENYTALMSECFTNEKLNILTTLKTYGDSDEEILARYYTAGNSEKLIAELNALQTNFVAFIEDEGFLPWLATNDTFGSIVDQIISKSDLIKSFVMTPVNPYINQNAGEAALGDLASALLNEGATTATVTGFANLYYDVTVSESYEGYADLTITVDGFTTKIPYYKDDFFDANAVDALEDKILELMNQAKAALGEAAKYYSEPVYQDLLPDVGENVAAYLTRVNEGFKLSYTPIKYYVTIEGSADEIPSVTYNGNSTELLLPTPTTKDATYTYIIAGVEISGVGYNKTGAPKKIKLADYGISFDKLFTSTNVTIKREVYNVTDVNFLAFVDALNDAFRSANADITFIPTYDILRPVDADTEYRYGLILRVGAGATSMSLGAMQDPLLDALGSYDNISFEGQTFFNGAKISTQSIIDLLANSGMSMDGIYAMIDNNGAIVNNTELQTLTPMSGSVKNVGGHVMTNTMTLTREIDAEDTETFNVALYTSLSGSSSQLVAVKKAIGTLKSYVNLSADEGVFDLHLDMPDKLYPYYMSAMILLDQTEFDNIQTGMNIEETMDYYKKMVGDLTGKDNFSTETIENTLAELGRNVDLSTYASTFNKAKKLINFLLDETAKENGQISINVLESTHENYKAYVECAAEPLFDRLPEQFDLVKMLIAEATPEGKLDFTFNVTIEDRDVNYTAMVFDNSRSGLNKFYYTADLTSALAGLGNNSIVVLMDNATLSADVTIPNNTFINLNGFTITGNLKTSARVTISDSTLHTTGNDVGGVNGTLSGNFIITGGKYTQNLTAPMLKDGYQQVDGYVSNIYYTFEEDENGNIIVNIPANILSKTTIPEIKALAVDIAMDAAFHLYNAASLYVDGSEIYSFDTKDLLSFASMSAREIADVLIGEVKIENVKALAKQIYAELMDFGAIAANINDDGVVAAYELTTYGWAFGFGVSNKNTVQVDLVQGEELNRNFSIVVVGTEEEKALLADLFTEVDKSLVKFAPAIDHFKVSYNGGLKVDYSGSLDVAIDLSHNNYYGALMVAAVASATNDAALKTVLANYLADEESYANINALATALENVKLSQFIKGLKHLKNVDCATMLSGLGIPTADSAEVIALEEIYGDLIYIAGILLERLDITGGDQMLKHYKTSEFASYSFGPETVKNITFSLALTLLTASPEIPDYTPVITVEKTADKDEYVKDETVKWTITVKNDSAYPAYDVVITDELTGDEWIIPTMKPGDVETFETSSKATPAGTLTNVVNVSWVDGDTYADDAAHVATASKSVLVIELDPDPDPDYKPVLDVTLTADKAQYNKGETITWTITVANNSSFTAYDVAISDALEGKNWSLASLSSGAEQSFVFTTEANQAVTVTNSATVTWKDRDTYADDADLTKTVTHSVSVVEGTTPPAPPSGGGSGSSKPVIRDPKIDTDISSDKMFDASVQSVGSIKYLHLDIHVDGMTVAEVLESLNIQATGSKVEITTEILNTKTVGDQEYVVTGSVLKITASNRYGKTVKEYTIVIDGDVNCDGFVNTADAVYIAWHYCDIASIEDSTALMAATGNSKDTKVHVDDAMRIVLKYLHWNTGDDRYVSKFGS